MYATRFGLYLGHPQACEHKHQIQQASTGRFVLYLPSCGFCVYVLEDGLSAGRNM